MNVFAAPPGTIGVSEARGQSFLVMGYTTSWPMLMHMAVSDYVVTEAAGGGLQDDLSNLLAIDKAKNNTSLVILLEGRGWKLLFPADAEQGRWWMTDHHNQLEEVHFLKVSHHGSHTGMPRVEMLEKVLPREGKVASDGRSRYAVVSTAPNTYSSVPDEDTLDELRQRCTLFSTKEDVEDAGCLYIDLEFEGEGNTMSVQTGGSKL